MAECRDLAWFTRPDHEVPVVRHQTVSEDAQGTTLANFGHEADERVVLTG
jgi:hypothetical protein